MAFDQRPMRASIRPSGVPAEKVSQLNPIVFPPGRQRAPEGRSAKGSPYILYAGNLHPYQDVDLLLRSFQIVAAEGRETDLVVVTHNDPSEWRKRAAASGLEGRVTFEYGLMLDEEWDRMSGADVLALPHLRCSGYPMKLLNYLAAARPIVASEDSPRGMSHGRNGYVVTESRPEAFAEGLLRVLPPRFQN